MVDHMPDIANNPLLKFLKKHAGDEIGAQRCVRGATARSGHWQV